MKRRRHTPEQIVAWRQAAMEGKVTPLTDPTNVGAERDAPAALLRSPYGLAPQRSAPLARLSRFPL
jgi:hypothetical protein